MFRVPFSLIPVRAFSATVLFLLAAGPLAAQERPPIIVDDYGPWKRITSMTISPDGAWMSWAQDRLEGEDSLYVKALDGETVHSIPRGGFPAFSRDARWVAYLISPPEKEGGRGGGATPSGLRPQLRARGLGGEGAAPRDAPWS